MAPVCHRGRQLCLEAKQFSLSSCVFEQNLTRTLRESFKIIETWAHHGHPWQSLWSLTSWVEWALNELVRVEPQKVIRVELEYLPRLLTTLWGSANLGKRVPLSWVVRGLNPGALEAVPLVLIPKPHNLVSPCMTLAPSELPLLFESPEWVPTNESFCVVVLRGHLGFQKSSISPGQWNLHWFSQPGFTWVTLSGTGALGSEHCMGLRPLILQGNLCSWDISSDSQPLLVGVGPAHFSSSPLLLVLMWLFYILVIWFLFSYYSGGYPDWLFYHLFVVLMWLWEVISTHTYPTILNSLGFLIFEKVLSWNG